MHNKTKIIAKNCAIVIGTILLTALICGVSWLATCGILYLIMLCFNIEFSWLTATGIWLILLVLKSVFKVTIKK